MIMHDAFSSSHSLLQGIISVSPAKTEENDKYYADMIARDLCTCEIRCLMSTSSELVIQKHMQKAKQELQLE